MNPLASIRSFFSGQSPEAFGGGERFPLTKDMVRNIREHIAALQRTDMSGYSFERRHSSYPGAKSDLIIYDGNKTPVLQGREVSGSHSLSFWTNS